MFTVDVIHQHNNNNKNVWKKSKQNNSETKLELQSFLSVARQLDPIHIPIKLHEDIPDGY